MPNKKKEYTPSEELIQYLMSTENFLDRPDNSLDGVWTIGFGDTDEELNNYYLKNRNLRYSRKDAEKRLRERVANDFLPQLAKTVPNWDRLTPAQKDSLLSYAYNVGKYFVSTHKNFARAMQDFDLARAAAELNASENDRRYPGLKKRRAMERAAFLDPTIEVFGGQPVQKEEVVEQGVDWTKAPWTTGGPSINMSPLAMRSADKIYGDIWNRPSELPDYDLDPYTAKAAEVPVAPMQPQSALTQELWDNFIQPGEYNVAAGGGKMQKGDPPAYLMRNNDKESYDWKNETVFSAAKKSAENAKGNPKSAAGKNSYMDNVLRRGMETVMKGSDGYADVQGALRHSLMDRYGIPKYGNMAYVLTGYGAPYSGYTASAGPAVIGKNLVDSYVYGVYPSREIGKPVMGNDYGIETDYINKTYPGRKVLQIETEPEGVPSQDGIKSLGRAFPAQGFFYTRIPGQTIDNQNIVLEPGVRNDSLFVRGMDVWDFGPGYSENWTENNLVERAAINMVDKLGTPIVTRTPYVPIGQINKIGDIFGKRFIRNVARAYPQYTKASGGKIHIKPENRGKFTALKERTGHSASWFKAHGTPAQKKMATFALNAKKWKHADGGPLNEDPPYSIRGKIGDLEGKSTHYIIENLLEHPITTIQLLRERNAKRRESQPQPFGGGRFSGAGAGGFWNEETVSGALDRMEEEKMKDKIIYAPGPAAVSTQKKSFGQIFREHKNAGDKGFWLDGIYYTTEEDPSIKPSAVRYHNVTVSSPTVIREVEDGAGKIMPDSTSASFYSGQAFGKFNRADDPNQAANRLNGMPYYNGTVGFNGLKAEGGFIDRLYSAYKGDKSAMLEAIRKAKEALSS